MTYPDPSFIKMIFYFKIMSSGPF